MIQIRIDSYPNIGLYTSPNRRIIIFKDGEEKRASAHFDEILANYKKEGKGGYGRIAMILREVDDEEYKETKRLRTEIII